MSELKAFESERIYWSVEQVEREAGDIDSLHLDDNLFYIKSEADKVIADLEMKLARAQLVLRLNKPEALYSNLETMGRLNHKIDVVERRERHQKYKRCLAKAEVEWLKRMILCNHPESISFRRAVKREHKWEALAEKFKEAK